ncbi:transcriptional regulator [Ammonicoccus fulvus]|uniref:Transcriptional regulator n=1 Tax=Ammonicoccus fulvus TaxID=3138240 RepID=A0ABZ3FMS6_9ACTN
MIDGFDEVVHAPHRLKICAMLADVDQVEFGVLRDGLGVADSVLSKQLKVLVDAGYVDLQKPTGRGGKVRTWARLTKDGRRAFEGHLAALRTMVESAREALPN